MGDGIGDALQVTAAQGELRFAVAGKDLGSLLTATVASPLHGTENVDPSRPGGELHAAADARNWSYAFPRHGMTLMVRAEPLARGVALAVTLTLVEDILLTALRVEFAFSEQLHLFHTGEVRLALLPQGADCDTVCYATAHEVHPFHLSSYDGLEDRLFRLNADCPYHTVSVRLRPSGVQAGYRPVIRVERIGNEYGYPWLRAGNYDVFSGSLDFAPCYRPRLYYPRALFSAGPLRHVLLAGVATPERLAWTAANLAQQLPRVVVNGTARPPRLAYWLPPGEQVPSVPAAPAAVNGGENNSSVPGLVAHIFRTRVDLLVFLVEDVGRPLALAQKTTYWLVTGRCAVLKYDRAGNAAFLLRGHEEILRGKVRNLKEAAWRGCVLFTATLAALGGSLLAVPALLLRARITAGRRPAA